MAAYIKLSAIGNLTRDPEIKYTPSGIIYTVFSIGVTRKWTDQSGNSHAKTNWVRITAWRKLAETIVTLTESGAMKKGSQVFISGNLDLAEYKSNSGEMKYSLDVTADDVILLGSRAEREAYEQQKSSGVAAPFDPFGLAGGNNADNSGSDQDSERGVPF